MLSVFIIDCFYLSFIVFQICTLMGHLGFCFSLGEHFMIFLPCFAYLHFSIYIIVSLLLLTTWTHMLSFSFSLYSIFHPLPIRSSFLYLNIDNFKYKDTKFFHNQYHNNVVFDVPQR